jgi:hypothetical protein
MPYLQRGMVRRRERFAVASARKVPFVPRGNPKKMAEFQTDGVPVDFMLEISAEDVERR